jgi:hypothetical protein
VDLSKVRGGQLIAAIGGVVLLVALLFWDWYEFAGLTFEAPVGSASQSVDFNAWDGQGFLGTLANLVILAAGLAAVGLALLTATARTVALPMAASAITAALGVGSVVMVVGRMLFQPGPNSAIDLKFGIFLALIGAVVVAYGGWQSMQEEGTTFDQAREQLQDRLGDDRPRDASPPGSGPRAEEPPAPPPPSSAEGPPGQPPAP